MFSKLRYLLINRKLDTSKMNDNLVAETKGYHAILNLTYEDLIGTLCLESANIKESELAANIYQCHQSDRFIAALLDPRTSFEYKKNAIFQIVEPKNVEYIRFAVKLKLKSHPTKALNKEDIKNIKAFLDWYGAGNYLYIFMRPDLSIANVLTYLNQVGSLKPDKYIDDNVCKLNSERLPRILIMARSPELLKCFHKLLNFYSNSLDSSYCSRHKLLGEVIQKQSSNYVSIEGTIPHRNCVYFFLPQKGNREACINDELLKSYSYAFESVNFENPSSYDGLTYSIYDMECVNDQVNIRSSDDLYEKEPLPKYSDIE
ncbi:hypothetical protein BN7_1893 [Wickerhamomyces ciferrii]|uniref:Uncharacterized protein n=1 Tax=Wickerhamomyces ciferrii (strain ATCC 14091 / BCRC 22168 / CBS 111 / JCM 3599 / NBRC 0793 / NRRL Y-1031 F-60-10) TaxID=1206466 RepID=K0KLX7_WICCF|nr:uncharacterized protein BN7_1893 [Wickerhamomyces ciferrii]CCH42349.1 hypothetical protein BN7_1893 [Wickerhamomyces ciferrii]